MLVLVLGVILCSLIKCSCGEEETPKARYGFVTFTTQWNSLLPGHMTPKTLRYCFYPSGNGAMIQTEGDANNLKFALPPDTYRVLVFNCDVENIEFSSMQKFDAAEASLNSSAEQKEYMPSPLYAVTIDQLTVSPGNTTSLSIEPKPLMQHIVFNIKVENGQSIRHCSASLSGISPAIKFRNRNRKDSSSVSIPFSMEKTDEGFMRNILLLDAQNDTATKRSESNMLKLDFLLTNNRIVSSTVDLGMLLSIHDNQNIQVEVNASIDNTSSTSITFRNWEVKPLKSEESANQL